MPLVNPTPLTPAPPASDEEGENQRIKDLHKRRRYLASYVNLILYNVLKIKHAAPIFKQYLQVSAHTSVCLYRRCNTLCSHKLAIIIHEILNNSFLNRPKTEIIIIISITIRFRQCRRNYRSGVAYRDELTPLLNTSHSLGARVTNVALPPLSPHLGGGYASAGRILVATRVIVSLSLCVVSYSDNIGLHGNRDILVYSEESLLLRLND